MPMSEMGSAKAAMGVLVRYRCRTAQLQTILALVLGSLGTKVFEPGVLYDSGSVGQPARTKFDFEQEERRMQ